VSERRNQGARLLLVGGGARSGKSTFALRAAAALGPRRIFIATAEALDAEMDVRIRRHRAERDPSFETREVPVALPEALEQVMAPGPAGASGADVVLIDCLTLWLSNLLVRDVAEAELDAAFERLDAVLSRRTCHVVAVSNEVGMGLVPETPLGRAFRDRTGMLHQRLAARADETYLAAMGVVLRLQPGPVEVVGPGPRGALEP